ncbi:hypothetical protein U0070_019845, partial [Myodes glareolus]
AYQGHHTPIVQKGLRYAIILFIVSEVFFFAGLIEGKRNNINQVLLITILLGVYFTILQASGYFKTSFSISDRIYGSTFFMATGFHGFMDSYILITPYVNSSMLRRNNTLPIYSNHNYTSKYTLNYCISNSYCDSSVFGLRGNHRSAKITLKKNLYTIKKLYIFLLVSLQVLSKRTYHVLCPIGSHPYPHPHYYHTRRKSNRMTKRRNLLLILYFCRIYSPTNCPHLYPKLNRNNKLHSNITKLLTHQPYMDRSNLLALGTKNLVQLQMEVINTITSSIFLILMLLDFPMIISFTNIKKHINFPNYAILLPYLQQSVHSSKITSKKSQHSSTLSQLGLITITLGINQLDLAFLHICTHAILFMCSGSIIRSLNDEQDIRKIGGLAKAKPFTSSCLIIAANTCHTNACDLLVTLVATSITAVYSIRIIYFVLITKPCFSSLIIINEKNLLLINPIKGLALGSIMAGFFISCNISTATI